MLKRVLTLASSVLLGLVIVCSAVWLLSMPTQVVRADTPPVTCPKIQTDFTTITTLVGSCYHFVTDTVAIAPGVIVTIAPPPGGATLYFNANTQIQVFGTLRALGQPGQLITFTSAMDNPSRGDWQGILFVDDGGSVSDGDIIQYSTIEYARTAILGGDEDFIDVVSNTLRYNGGGVLGGAIGGDTDNSNIILVANSVFMDKEKTCRQKN